jgi:hypothetical protein
MIAGAGELLLTELRLTAEHSPLEIHLWIGKVVR